MYIRHAGIKKRTTMFKSSDLGVELGLVLRLGLKIELGLGLGFAVAFNCN